MLKIYQNSKMLKKIMEGDNLVKFHCDFIKKKNILFLLI